MVAKSTPERSEEIAQGGVPWDTGTLRAIEQDLRARDQLTDSDQISQHDIFLIMGVGDKKIPLTNAARSMFARNALRNLASRDPGETKEEVVEEAVDRTVALLRKQEEVNK